jgi:hypothetical protein
VQTASFDPERPSGPQTRRYDRKCHGDVVWQILPRNRVGDMSGKAGIAVQMAYLFLRDGITHWMGMSGTAEKTDRLPVRSVFQVLNFDFLCPHLGAWGPANSPECA